MDFKNAKFPVIPSPHDKRDWKAESIYAKIKLPTEIDYRPDMFNIRDQGNQGSCAAMAGSAMKEWQEIKDVNLITYLSPQFIYNNREDPDSEGMYMRDLMKILQKMGDCYESLCPYGSLEKPSLAAYNNADDFLIKSYASVDTIEGLKNALYNNGPCVIAVPVYNLTERMWLKRPGNYLLGGHAMAVVGYSKTGFIIRNSWGDDWGDNGYCTFPYEDWGCQYEVWTTIDAESDDPQPPPPEPNKTWFEKYWWILLTIVIVTVYFIFK